jgi:hypothetical protein
MDRKPGGGASVPSAQDLRMSIIQKQMAEYELRKKKKEEDERKRSAFADDFLANHVTEQERAMIRRLVMNAVEEGKTEALVYSFPSSLCTDAGRAINNSEPGWPASLQGKARELYERFKTVAQPQGYKLKAMILDFPGGMPGDVGLFLDWGGNER